MPQIRNPAHPVSAAVTREPGGTAMSQRSFRATGTGVCYRPIANGQPEIVPYVWQRHERGRDAEVAARLAEVRAQAASKVRKGMTP